MNAAVMSDHTLDAIIRKVLSSRLTASPVEFLWHAGEPLTVGVDFYKRACQLVKNHNQRQIRVRQKVQTNGTLIDHRWCQFFSEEKFGVGVSIDGPQFLHDKQRPNWAGRGSHRHVMRGVELLTKYRIHFGALSVVTAETLNFPDEFYRFFTNNGFDWLGINLDEVEGSNRASSLMLPDGSVDNLTLERYTRFIERLFDLWRHDQDRIVIREFRDVLHMLAGKLEDPTASYEADETAPINTITVQRDGAISTNSPEFASSQDPRFNNFNFGNINEVEIETVFQNQNYLELQKAIRSSVQRCSESCMYFDLCGGRYLSNKHAEHGHVEATETVICKLHRQVVASVIVDKLSRGQDQLAEPTRIDFVQEAST